MLDKEELNFSVEEREETCVSVDVKKMGRDHKVEVSRDMRKNCGERGPGKMAVS